MGAMANQYDLGDLIRLSATFKNASDVDTDPTTVTLRVRHNSGTPTTTYTYEASEVSRLAAGQFYKDVTLSKSGTWYYRWEGSGSVQQQEEKAIVIRSSHIVAG